MKNINVLNSTILFVTLFCCLLSCKKNSPDEAEVIQDSITNVVESAIAEATSISKSLSIDTVSPVFAFDQSERSYLPEISCDPSENRSSCENASRTLSYNSCTIDRGSSYATVQGTINEIWIGTGQSFCGLFGNQAQLKRFISESSPKVVTLDSGAKLTTTMNPKVAFDNTTFENASEGTVITRLHSGTSNDQTCDSSTSTACFRVQINGLQKIMVSSKGKTWFNHIMSGDITFVGDRQTTNRRLTGTTSIWHQVSLYKAVHQFIDVEWGFEDECIFPTSGHITTQFTGAIKGETTTTFNGECGKAIFTGIDGKEKTLSLSLTE